MAEHFFIVGAQRCGTTYLCELLAGHPEVEMARPVRPEPKFFLDDELHAKGLDEYGRRFFGHNPGSRLRGEKSTSYIESELAARRIAESFPDARIVCVLRDPVERAVSNYWFSVNSGLEELSLEEAMRAALNGSRRYERERISTNPFDYVAKGRYLSYLSVYDRYFPPDRIAVLVYERLIRGRAEVDRLLAFLGASPGVALPALGRVVNPSRRGTSSLPRAFAAELAAHFAAPNARLAERLGSPLLEWGCG